MRIYHNVPALSAYNALNSTTNAMTKAIKQLSTGLRINTAADDAAGLAISEKMRAQISGMEQATINAQNGISMIQTAEGALSNTHSILQRMRELSVEAANDTLTAEDRSYIQLEIDELVDQIDNISNNTQFNGKRLLDGSSAGTWSSADLTTKAYIRGSLRVVDQFNQKSSFEGNYKIRVRADPGTAQAQKTSIFKIKHENTLTDKWTNTKADVQNVRVDNVPAGTYKLTAVATAAKKADVGTAKLTGYYVSSDFEGTISATTSVAGVNASILFEVVRKSADDKTIVLKATSNVLKMDGTVENYVDNSIVLTADDSGNGSINLGVSLLGATDSTAFQLNLDAFKGLQAGNKFVFNVQANNDAPVADRTGSDGAELQANYQVRISGDQDENWPSNWIAGEETGVFRDETGKSTEAVFNISADAVASGEIHFRNFYLNSNNGSVMEGNIVLTLGEDFATNLPSEIGNSSNEATLSTFTANYVGKVATGDSCLRDLEQFWNSNGVFMLDDPQTITITQGNGKSTSITIYGTDTLNDLRSKLNDALANGLGQAAYVQGGEANKFVTFVENTEDVNGLETVNGTFIIRSLIAGAGGDLTISGGEDLINSLGLNVVQSSSENAFTVSIEDAHTGSTIASNVKVTGNQLVGVIHPNIDIEFDAMANVTATWSKTLKNFILSSETDAYETILHIADNSTVFQTGANEGEDMSISIGDMSANALGINGVNVMTRENASRSITILDNAINTVSRQRAKLGAYQNAMEYTVDNLTTTTTNLTEAESRIRDTDMAKAMMEFVKLQILNQSGTSMLAQANQLPQSVLSLLG